MFSWLNKITEKIKSMSNSIDTYKKETIIQSLPTLTYVNRAKKLIDEKKYEEAKEVLIQALELPQKDALVYKYLGATFEKLGNHELATENYQISAELNPQDKLIWQRLGFSLITNKEFERAEKSFENANRVQPANSDTLTGWGMSLMKQLKFSEAREKFAQAINFNKYNFSAVFLCAVMEIKLAMYDKAEPKLSFLANVSPNESNTFELARLKAIKNDIDNAIHYAQKSLSFNSMMLPAYILLGQLYTSKFDKENAIKSFQTAEDKDLKTSSLYAEWGKVLAKFENYEEAKEKLNKANELEPENTEVMAYLGLTYVSLRDFDNAKPLLEKVSAKEPNNIAVKQALAIVSYEQNNIQNALSIFRINDEDAVNCYYMAKCYEKLNDNTKVIDYFEASIRINPTFTSAYIDYAKYLIDKENFAEAQRKLRKALKNDNENIELLNLMFYTSYMLVKDEVYEYNVKEAISIAEHIEAKNPELFRYFEQKAELIRLLEERRPN